MSQRKRPPAPARPAPGPSRPPRAGPPALTVLNANAAGIDVHSDMHMVCVPADRVASPAESAPGGLPAHVRRFGANSCDLHAIADWLKECGVTTVALESTGPIPVLRNYLSVGQARQEAAARRAQPAAR